MTRWRRILHWTLIGGAAVGLIGVATVAGVYLYVAPSLPSVSILKDIHLQVPLRIYTRDGRLIGMYGNKRRIPLHYKDLPPMLVEAFISAEDDRFFEHPGLDLRSLVRASINLIVTGRKSQGASTITMQLARNFFLTRKKLYIRKIREIFLALRIEHKLTKEQILDLYLNKIYLGNHAYGVGAAAQVYYGKDVYHLTLAQMAMIAGLPKAPSAFNPIADPHRALERRAYVLGRMRVLGFIDQSAYQHAMAAPITAHLHGPQASVHAPYVAEMVRNWMLQQYGPTAYTAGFQVTTTIDARLQHDANRALWGNLQRLSREKGYHGPIKHVAIPSDPSRQLLSRLLSSVPQVANLQPAVVLNVQNRSIDVDLAGDQRLKLGWSALSWAAPHNSPENAAAFLKRGDLIYLYPKGHSWELAQIPRMQGALVSVDPYDGAIAALVGGYSYALSKYNRAIQAHRQLGSSFKPFIYSAALHEGLTPATMISNAPLVYLANKQLSALWRPENYERTTSGFMRLSLGLIHSINIVSVRVLEKVGIADALKWSKRFGFKPSVLPHNLTMVLGSASLTPLTMARAYSVFDNGGYLVAPYLIQRVSDAGGNVLAQAHPLVACKQCMAHLHLASPVSARPPRSSPSPATSQSQAADAATTSTTAQTAANASTSSALPSSMSVIAPQPVSGSIAASNQRTSPVAATATTTEASAAPAKHTANSAAGATGSSAPAKATLPPPPASEQVTFNAPATSPQPPRLAPRVLTPQNAYLMVHMLQGVIQHGTGQAARSIGRSDLAGKTGTTNDYSNAWFDGFAPRLVAVTWVGYDQPQSLGYGQTGARAALPMWIYFMKHALSGVPERTWTMPPGLVTVRIDSKTGLRCGPGDRNAIWVTFRKGHLPPWNNGKHAPSLYQ